MANKITSGKRDVEKKKQQKLQEKQKRKEERASSATRSFDDMIAYVDENGNLHSTPPERINPVVDSEDISISTPKKEKEENSQLNGRVEFFNAEKGFGFIKDIAGTEKYFFHISEAPKNIAINNKVTFEIERTPRGKNAVRISII